jgi:hypothetical protein
MKKLMANVGDVVCSKMSRNYPEPGQTALFHLKYGVPFSLWLRVSVRESLA